MPKRIQRKRTKGWRMPTNTVYVGRPTKWGNPFDNVGEYAHWILRSKPGILREIVSELKGKDLACWCPIGKPCHADVLLELANASRLLLCDECGSLHADDLDADNDDAPWCPTCEELTDMLLLSEDEGWQCQQCAGDNISVEWTDERGDAANSQKPEQDEEKTTCLPDSPVVCICGSTRFRDQIHEANRRLTMAGIIVLAPGVFGHAGDSLTDDDKAHLDILHLTKITMSDGVLVVCPGGYIGSSTEREIHFAEQFGKPVWKSIHATISAIAPNPTPSAAP